MKALEFVLVTLVTSAVLAGFMAFCIYACARYVEPPRFAVVHTVHPLGSASVDPVTTRTKGCVRWAGCR